MAERGVIFKDDFVHTPNSSWFDMSYDFIFSHNIGELVPSVCMECLPEDVIHQKSTNFSRLSPLVAPTFGKLNMFSYHFYVRNRDIWTNWPSFYTEKNQRKSWQSEMRNPSFVPPVMPYLDVRKIVYDSPLYITKDLNGDHFLKVTNEGGHDGCIELHVDGLNLISNDSIRFLVIENYAVGVDSHSSAYTVRSLDAIYLPVGCLIIPYIVNKNEMDYSYINTKHYYNPFSNGSLMDYLGCDLSGMYFEQIEWLNKYLHHLTYNFSIGTVVPAEPDQHLTLREMELMDYQPIGFNDYSFFKEHVILGAIGCIVAEGSNRWFNASTDGKVYEADYSDNSSEIFTSTVDPLYFDDESSKINSLPIRAYYFVYSEYFRDQNYIDVNENVDFTRDGEDIDWDLDNDVIFDYLTLKIKAWEHDPYTSALPQSQKGDPVRFLNDANLKFTATESYTSNPVHPLYVTKDSNVASGDVLTDFVVGTTKSSVNSNVGTLTVDLSAATVENLRFANARQRYLEKVARSGSREYEYLLAIWGADVADAKLNRPIYLSGDKSPVQISEVLQTSASQFDDSQPLGQMAGRGVSVGSDDYLEYVCPDSGFFIEICTVIPRVSYQQGLVGMFTRKLKLDYPLPDYAQLGEEQVPVSELWYSARDSEDSQPFGYQSRYYSFKYNRDRISGEFKSSLNHWTWSRIFKDRPYASKDFLEVNPDYRQFAVTDKSAEHIYSHMFHDIQVKRKLPVFGVPSL